MAVEATGGVNPNWEWTFSVPDLNDPAFPEPLMPEPLMPTRYEAHLGQDVIKPLLKNAISFADHHCFTLGSSTFEKTIGVATKVSVRLLEAVAEPFIGQVEPKTLSPNFKQLGNSFSSHPWAAVTDYLSQTDGEALATDGVLAAQSAFAWLVAGRLFKGDLKIARWGGLQSQEQAQSPTGPTHDVDLSAGKFWNISRSDPNLTRITEKMGACMKLGWSMRGTVDAEQTLSVDLRNFSTSTPNQAVYRGLLERLENQNVPVKSVITALTRDRDLLANPLNQEFNQFMCATAKKGQSTLSAAENSPLGQAARELGFTETDVQRTLTHPGEVKYAIVRFSKPFGGP